MMLERIEQGEGPTRARHLLVDKSMDNALKDPKRDTRLTKKLAGDQKGPKLQFFKFPTGEQNVQTLSNMVMKKSAKHQRGLDGKCPSNLTLLRKTPKCI